MSGGQIMVVLIVLIAVIGGIVKGGLRHEAKRLRMTGSGEGQALRDEVRRLSERVRVLERVVTDDHGKLGLDREIERLRD